MQVHNTELLSARTATATQESAKKGIHKVSIGSMEINFSHDMTTTFKWGGIILALVIVKILRKGKYAFIEEPNTKYIASNLQEKAELHEYVCEQCRYTLFPARGRDGKFFPDDFRCAPPPRRASGRAAARQRAGAG